MFGKIFATMFTGSMFGKGPVSFALMAYIIANMDQDGHIELNPILLAATFGCTVEEVEKSIADFCAPDVRSRSLDMDGAKLVRVDEIGMLYWAVNHKKYLDIKKAEDRRKTWRDSKQKTRAALKIKDVHTCPQQSTVSTHIDIDKDVDKEIKPVQDGVGQVPRQAPAVPPTTVVYKPTNNAPIKQSDLNNLVEGIQNAEDLITEIQRSWDSSVKMKGSTIPPGHLSAKSKDIVRDSYRTKPDYALKVLKSACYCGSPGKPWTEKFTPGINLVVRPDIADDYSILFDRMQPVPLKLPPPPSEEQRLLLLQTAEENRLRIEKAEQNNPRKRNSKPKEM